MADMWIADLRTPQHRFLQVHVMDRTLAQPTNFRNRHYGLPPILEGNPHPGLLHMVSNLVHRIDEMVDDSMTPGVIDHRNSYGNPLVEAIIEEGPLVMTGHRSIRTNLYQRGLGR